eukprot:NODE_349_length_8994_cov_1.235526.p9 type:complete len:151 gc:universal NODE_349_length_8994_cov_1.235526:7547-7095(-)
MKLVLLLSLCASFLIEFNGTDPALVDNSYLIYPRDNLLIIPKDGKIVQIQSTKYQYPDVIISGKNCTLRGFAHDRGVSQFPCQLRPSKEYEYDVPKPGFSILGFLKNPTMLMTMVSFGLMFFMPKLMETMEQEQEKDRPKDIRDIFLTIK